MPSSGMLCSVLLVRTDLSGERIASIIRAKIIGDIGKTLEETSNRIISSQRASAVASYC
jgi:hypothetical protein